MLVFAAITLVVVTALAPASAATVPALSAPPWSGSDLVPADVDLFVHIDDPAGLRRARSSMPLVMALQSALVDDEVAARWSAVAQRLGRTEEQCFADLLGRDIVFAMREGDESIDWVLVTQIDDATVARVTERLNGKMSTGNIIDFPCQGVVAVWREPQLLIGPSRTAPLLLHAVAQARDRSSTLAQHDLVRRTRSWSPSSVQFFMRHPGIIAGTSVLTAEFRDGTASVRHLAQLDRMHSDAEAEEPAPLDTTLLARFESIAIAGVMRRQCDAPTAALITALIPEAKPCEGMRRNAGERWMLLVGAVDGAPLVPCTLPAVAIAVEVREPCAGRRQHETMLHRGVEGYNARYASSFGGEITPPEVAACADIEDPRQCDLSRPLRAASGNHPLVRSCSLHWRTVVGDDGNWQVYASHREWLDKVTRQLERDQSSERGRTKPALKLGARGARAQPEGFMHGREVAAMLESWKGAANEFVSTDPERFQEAIGNFATLLRGAECVRWRMHRPEPQLLETHLRVELAKPSTP